MLMKNNVTVGLSLTSIRAKISAQCAWVDATNVAVLPPVLNPLDVVDISAILSTQVSAVTARYSAWVTSLQFHDDIIRVDMQVGSAQQRMLTAMSTLIEDIIVHSTLVALYSVQAEAAHIARTFSAILALAESSFKQMLAVP